MTESLKNWENWRFSEKDLQRVKRVLASNFSSSRGTNYCLELEKLWAECIGTKYAVVYTSGTTTLHGALHALGIGKDDEVICPALNVIMTSNAVIFNGSVPVFADVQEDTFNVDPADIEKKITDKTKAIFMVPFYGLPCDVDEILRIGHEYNIPVIEDNAQAVGAKYKEKILGSLGRISSFSMESSKTIACFPEGAKVVVSCGRGKYGASKIYADSYSKGGSLRTTKKIEDLQVGDKMISYNETTGEKEFDIIKGTFKRSVSEDLVDIIFSNGNRIKCTKEHPIFVLNRGWVKATDIQVGDYVIQLKYIHWGRLRVQRLKGKTYEEIFGTKRAEEISRRKRKALKALHRDPNSAYHRVDLKAKGRKISETLCAKHMTLSVERRKRNSEVQKRRFQNPDERRKLSKIVKQSWTPERKKKQRLTSLRLWQDPGYVKKVFEGIRKANADPSVHKKRVETIRRVMTTETYWKNYQKGMNTKPNKLEKELQVLLDSVCRGEFEYNGDMSLGIRVDRMIPDFVNVNGKKKVIEFFGEHWHRKHADEEFKTILEHEVSKKNKYKKFGFECLVIWDWELRDKVTLQKKIMDFVVNPSSEVVTVVRRRTEHYSGNVYNLAVEKNNNYFVHGILVHNCGQGGLCCTNDKVLYNKLRSFRFHGYRVVSEVTDPHTAKDVFQDPDYYRHVKFGWSYLLPEVVCAIGVGQMERFDFFVNLRKEIGRMYEEVVDGSDLLVPQYVSKKCESAYWTFAAKFQGTKDEWRRFRKLYMANGGDGIYACFQVPYKEPVYMCPEPQYLSILNKSRRGNRWNCEVAERIQPMLMQFCTNYGSVEEAEPKVAALRKTLKEWK